MVYDFRGIIPDVELRTLVNTLEAPMEAPMISH
jgi:hypothetical protein